MEILLVNFAGCFICHLVLNLQIISLHENKLHVMCMQTLIVSHVQMYMGLIWFSHRYAATWRAP